MSKRPRSESSPASSDNKRLHWSLGTAGHDRHVYAALDPALIGADGDQLARSVGSGSVPALISSLVANDTALRSAQDKLEYRHLLLGTQMRDRPSGTNQAPPIAAVTAALSKRQLNRRGLVQIDRSAISYSLFRGLNQLWGQYFAQVTASSDSADVLQSKLLKADLHGAVLAVVRSRNPGLIGLRGIVFKETQYTFEIVTKTNSRKVIPKDGAVLGLAYKGHLLQIFGRNFLYRPSQRSAKKFKSHGVSLEL